MFDIINFPGISDQERNAALNIERAPFGERQSDGSHHQPVRSNTFYSTEFSLEPGANLTSLNYISLPGPDII